MKLKYFSLAFSISGILVLYLLSRLSHPAIIDIYELPNYEGKQVTIEGIVTEYYLTRYGSQVISIEEQNASAKVSSIVPMFTNFSQPIFFADKTALEL